MPRNTRCAPKLFFKASTSISDCLASRCMAASRKKRQYQSNQDHVGKNHEQRGKHHGTGGGASDALRAALCAHPLETGNDADNATEDRGLDHGNNEIVELHVLESVIHKVD